MSLRRTVVNAETPLQNLRGTYRDRLYTAQGQLIWDRGWCSNVIVVDCRRLLAGFMLGTPNTLGIQALQVGAGLEIWDDAPPARPQATDTALIDPHPFTIARADLNIAFLDPTSDATSPLPTNRIQIRATLKAGVPPWADVNHATSTLREFGLVARLNGSDVLINNVRHSGIAKDPTSTLERTIWLVF